MTITRYKKLTIDYPKGGMKMRDLDWKWAKYGPGLDCVVPTSPGIYALASVRRVHGLPTEMEYIYIGKSNNLRRRWTEHLDIREPNPGLHGLGGRYTYEFWWIVMPVDQLSRVEAELIAEIKPPANRIGKRENGSRLPGDDCC